MRIETIAIDRINPAPYNPRVDLQPGDPDYDRLLKSIEAFGCVEPLIWNHRTGNLVGGHQRLKILRARGDTEADVSVVDLPPAKEKALNVALNKISGDWDPRKLAELLEELTQLPDFDIELTGFDLPDADALIAEILRANDHEEDFDVEAALRPDEPAITQPGDLIELGRHRLICGDSALPGVFERLLEDRRVDLLFTDPPYNVDYYGGNRPTPEGARPKPSRQWKRIYSDNLSQDQYVDWLRAVFTNACTSGGGGLSPGAAFYIWNGHRQFGPMHLMLEELGLKISCVITWAKESFAIGYGDYNQQTEFCLYGWLPAKGSHKWYGPSNASTLWQVHRDPTRSYEHPTQKPLELAERAIRNSTRAGELVLDTFLGSGTTLIAAERLGRACGGIEIDPHYCDVIVRRYIAFVGESNVERQLIDRYPLEPQPAEQTI